VVFGLFFTFLPVVIIIFVIAYATKNKGKGDEAVIRHLYTYLVLFATLMMVIGGGISIFMATADIVSPPSYYQSYEDYKQIREEGKIQSEKNLSEADIRANFEQAIKDEKSRNVENAKNQLIKSLGFIVIPLPIFLFFNGKRKRQSDI
jgi:glucan phosphoethanolaminetransferase (alkaline phosphatase superfamily)